MEGGAGAGARSRRDRRIGARAMPRARHHVRGGPRGRGGLRPMSYGTLALIVAVGLLGPLVALMPTRVAPPGVIRESVAGAILRRTGPRPVRATQPAPSVPPAIGF